jgi:hypothetical protein
MKQDRAVAVRGSPGPFWTLVAHFIRRILSNENEQGGGPVGLGLGTVLAILASPGAFASILLADKYSPLLQWLRHQHLDPFKASVSDEYFFIVMSMTITGLIMVLRWNRLFPDRRDFWNLAPLPIPIRNIFLANFAALFGLALLFAIDVNAASAFLFPAVVTMGSHSVTAFFHLAISHAVAVMAASLFSFFGVFALAGWLMLAAPRRWFRLISVCARLLLVIALLTECLANLFFQLFAGRIPVESATSLKLLPSFWFLGLYQSILGVANASAASLGKQALLSLGGAVVLAVIAYSLCYRRYFLRLPESLETIGGGRTFRLRLPERALRLSFRSPFEHACCSFALKVLTRSEQHIMFFGGYLGLGLVIVAQTVFESTAQQTPGAIPSPALLAVPLMIGFFVISGLRFAFDIPAALDANWLFRIAIFDPPPDPRPIARKLMLWSVLPWQVFVLCPVMAARFGWPAAIRETATVIALTVIFIEVVLVRFRKIPFTCSVQPELRQLLLRILGSLFAVLLIVPMLARAEHWVLSGPARLALLAPGIMLAWYLVRRYRRDLPEIDRVLVFEERPPAAFEFLHLAEKV